MGIWVWTAALLGACDGGAASTGDGASAQDKEVSLTTGNSTVKDGGKFFTPLDNGTSTVALFSEQKDIWTLRNNTAAEITTRRNRKPLHPRAESAIAHLAPAKTGPSGLSPQGYAADRPAPAPFVS